MHKLNPHITPRNHCDALHGAGAAQARFALTLVHADRYELPSVPAAAAHHGKPQRTPRLTQAEWLRRVSAAQRLWGKLSARELRETEGKERRLADLLQGRYPLTREQAREQARSFLRSTAL